MPNWTVNRLTFEGNPERISELKNHILSIDEHGNPQFDFNRVIPMPEHLKNTPSDYTSDILTKFFNEQEFISYETYSMWYNDSGFKPENKVTEEVFDGKAVGFAKFGAIDWYHWCMKNWGVKWNACETHVYDNDKPNIFVFRFETPWGEPQHIFSKLHDQYSDLEMRISFTHEGGFGGQYITWNPVDKIFTVQELKEVTVYQDEDGNVIECGYDEETDEYLDKDGNVIEDNYFDWWSPSEEKIIVPLEEAVW